MGLQNYGFKVDIFNNPQQALLQFKPNYYDDIILDVRMPGMSGFDLAKEIWAKDPTARICFFTALEFYEDDAMTVLNNIMMQCFIIKPITIKKLVQHIEAHFITA